MMNHSLGTATMQAVIDGSPPKPVPVRRPRQRITVFLPIPLIERLRNAVYWTEQRPLAQIIAEAIDDAVSEMEQANGGVFPPRLSALKPGRPRRPGPSASPSTSLHVIANR
jgi:hypothetical protein